MRKCAIPFKFLQRISWITHLSFHSRHPQIDHPPHAHVQERGIRMHSRLKPRSHTKYAKTLYHDNFLIYGIVINGKILLCTEKQTFQAPSRPRMETLLEREVFTLPSSLLTGPQQNSLRRHYGLHLYCICITQGLRVYMYGLWILYSLDILVTPRGRLLQLNTPACAHS